MSVNKYLEEKYLEGMVIVGSNIVIKSNLPDNYKRLLNILLNKSESAKGVFTVFLTSLVYKTLH